MSATTPTHARSSRSPGSLSALARKFADVPDRRISPSAKGRTAVETPTNLRKGLGGAAENPQPLFRRILPGPHHLSRDAVSRNQRLRLIGALLVVTREGRFTEATVTELARLAGVSRRAFYEQFANAHELRLAAFDAVAADLLARMSPSAALPADPRVRALAVAERVMAAVAVEPGALRLLAAGAALDDGVRARTLLTVAAATLRKGLLANGESIPSLLGSAIVAGAYQMLVAFEGTPVTLSDVCDALAGWLSLLSAREISELADPDGEYELASTLKTDGVARPAGEFEQWVLDSALRAAITFGPDVGASAAAIADMAGIQIDTVLACYGSGEDCLACALARFEAHALDGARNAAASASVTAAGAAVAAEAACRELLCKLVPIAPGARNADVSPATLRTCNEPAGLALKRLVAATIAEACGLAAAGAPTDTAIGAGLWHLATSTAARALAHRALIVRYMTFLVLAPRLCAGMAVREIAREGAARA
jgi:AcrR family transcriptional regulator